MNLFKRKTRKEVVESKIENLFDEVASLDFTNEEIAHIAQGFRCKARRVLRLRAEQLWGDYTATVEALNLMGHSDERKESEQPN